MPRPGPNARRRGRNKDTGPRGPQAAPAPRTTSRQHVGCLGRRPPRRAAPLTAASRDLPVFRCESVLVSATRRFPSGNNREQGAARSAKALTAPATVGGWSAPRTPLGNREGRARGRNPRVRRPAVARAFAKPPGGANRRTGGDRMPLYRRAFPVSQWHGS